ncbi:MAG: hypothetical protein ACOYL6_16325 [Bacteriovoracaceae bacterium]
MWPTNRLNTLKFLCFILTFVSKNIHAKNLKGDSFRTSYESTFLQGEFASKLNSLHVLASPLPGEPFYPDFLEQDEEIKIPFQGRSGIFIVNDDFKKLMEVYPEYPATLNNVNLIDASHLQSGKSKLQTWSYHSFPTYKGGLAQRFLDNRFSLSDSWLDYFHEYEKNPPEKLVAKGKIDILSPLEKYEYLIGNTSFSLTKGQWMEGQKYFSEYGEVSTWIGYCHGTAPASIAVARPENAITLKSFDKLKDITFYPSDIKELVSYAWAISGGPSAMIGTRCGEALTSGSRPTQNCLDVNPGAFHLTAVNLLGIHGQPFIIDSSSGYEVWNRTVISYKYRYFRPGSHNLTPNIKNALLARKDYVKDPYAQFRSPKATYIVGVSMEITYISSTKPSSSESDSPDQDEIGTSAYRYDLELDDNGVIVGGEWNDINHPDFAWVVSKSLLPRTLYDHIIGNGLLTYTGQEPLPDSILKNAHFASDNGEILYSVLEAMVRLSRAQSKEYMYRVE